jgi:tRNA C32,U32 (ribose-2'-O)-methylase TrmJ
MNQTTSRDISKSVQLKHTKEKLHEMGHDRSNKKKNLVKSLKNLMKRKQRNR